MVTLTTLEYFLVVLAGAAVGYLARSLKGVNLEGEENDTKGAD